MKASHLQVLYILPALLISRDDHIIAFSLSTIAPLKWPRRSRSEVEADYWFGGESGSEHLKLVSYGRSNVTKTPWN